MEEILINFYFSTSCLETIMEAKATHLIEIYLKAGEAQTNSTFNSQEDDYIHFICSYYPGTCTNCQFPNAG
jgi:hypothetical protein